MFPYNYNIEIFAMARQQELLKIAQHSRTLKQLKTDSPSWKDRLFIHVGNWLILAGTRLRSYSELSENSFFSELSRETL